MRLCYMMATPELKTQPLSWVGDYHQIMPRLAEIGYAGVELSVRNPAEFDAADLESCARATGLHIAAVTSVAIGTHDGLYLMSPDAATRRQAIDRYKTVLELAARYGVDPSIGRFRGLAAWAPDRATALGWFRAALEELLPEAERLGVRIVLEPQMRFIGDVLNTIAETLAFIASFDSPHLTFEGDLFHQAMEEKSLLAALATMQLSGRMSFLQISDSNRLAPGWGHHNWVDIIEVLKAVDYTGWLSMEFTQSPDSDTCARQAYQTLQPLLD
jgi:5-keto-L-gluconate epimerase